MFCTLSINKSTIWHCWLYADFIGLCLGLVLFHIFLFPVLDTDNGRHWTLADTFSSHTGPWLTPFLVTLSLVDTVSFHTVTGWHCFFSHWSLADTVYFHTGPWLTLFLFTLSLADTVSFHTGPWLTPFIFTLVPGWHNSLANIVSQGHHTTDRLEERGVESRTIFLERTREGHRQSNEHWNRFKGNVGETSERRGGAHTFS